LGGGVSIHGLVDWWIGGDGLHCCMSCMVTKDRTP
jgi:hypothetical protein